MRQVIINFIRTHKFFMIAGFLLWTAGLIILFLTLDFQMSKNNDQLWQLNYFNDSINHRQMIARHLDGVLIEPGTENRFLKAVAIDNSWEGRSYQAGLNQASLIYEFPVEAYWTRLITFFIDQSVDKIGPVRSARAYFLPIIYEYQALFAHIGGSPEAILKINERQKAKDLHDLDEYYWYNTEYFWREKNKPAPHNLFTKSESLDKAVGNLDLDKTEPNYQIWQFKDDLAANQRPADSDVKPIIINWSVNTNYRAEFLYDRETNNYRRYAGSGTKNLQDDNIKNIIIQKIKKPRVVDEIGRLDLELIGRGQAIIFQDGKNISGYWIKNDNFSRTKFYNDHDQEILFNRGKTWIEVFPENFNLDY